MRRPCFPPIGAQRSCGATSERTHSCSRWFPCRRWMHFQHRAGTPAWGHQTTAWKIKHKLMQVMMEREAAKRLRGRIEVDDGGKRGRGSPGKTPIVAAVETTPQGQPMRLKLRRVRGFRCSEITALARHNFNPTSTVVTDGLRCFTGVGKARLRSSADHHPIWPPRCPDARVQVGQDHPCKHQKRDHWHLPCHPLQACAPLPRRIRIPVQPALRSRRHDAAARLHRPPNSTNALSPPQIS
jgi:hypothetical protein